MYALYIKINNVRLYIVYITADVEDGSNENLRLFMLSYK